MTASVTTAERHVQMTTRDAAALLWIAEMYGADYGVLAVLLARLSPLDPKPVSVSLSAVRKQVGRWQRAGWVSVLQRPESNWVTLKPAGYRMVGYGSQVWAAPVNILRHTQCVNVLRLWYESQPVSEQFPWVSERRIRANRTRGFSVHICDGEIQSPQTMPGMPPEYYGIEVELAHKERPRYANEVFGCLRAGIQRLMYFAPDQQFADRLQLDLEWARRQRGSQIGFSVEVLPTVEGVSYQERW